MFKVCYVRRKSRKLNDKSQENVKMSIGKMWCVDVRYSEIVQGFSAEGFLTFS